MFQDKLTGRQGGGLSSLALKQSIFYCAAVVSLRHFYLWREAKVNVIQKSEAIKTGLRKGFQDGSSKMAKRRCYGYKVNSSGGLIIDPDEAQTVHWIFEQYLDGDSLGKIANELER